MMVISNILSTFAEIFDESLEDISVIAKPGKPVFVRCLAQTAHCSAYR